MSRGFRSVRNESFDSPMSPGASFESVASPRSANAGGSHHQRQVSHSVMLRLKILDGLRLNQRVHVKDYGDGRVKFLGCVHFAQGLFVGIELEQALGKHDGSFRGKRYFSAKPKHGIFVRKSRVQVIDNPPPSTRASRAGRQQTSSLSARNLRLPPAGSSHLTQNIFIPLRGNASLSVTLAKKVLEPQGIPAKLEFVIDMCRKELEAMGDSSHIRSIPENRSLAKTSESLPILDETTPTSATDAPRKRRFLSWTEVPSLKNIGVHLGLTPRQKGNEEDGEESPTPSHAILTELHEKIAEQNGIIEELRSVILQHEDTIREIERENGEITENTEALQRKLAASDEEIDQYQTMYLELQDEIDKVRSDFDDRLREAEAENLRLYKELSEQQQIINENANFAETQKHTQFRVTELERKVHDLQYSLLYGDSQKDQVISDCYKTIDDFNSKKSRQEQEMKSMASSMRNVQHQAIEEWIFEVGDHILEMNALDAY